MKQVSFSLSKKSLLAVVVILLPILFTFVYDYSRNKETLRDEIFIDLTALAESYEGQVHLFLEKAKTRAEDFASDGFIRRRLEGAASGDGSAVERLTDHLKRNKLPLDATLQEVHILDLSGTVVASTSPGAVGEDLSGEDFFNSGMSGVGITDSRVTAEGDPDIAVSAPITDLEGEGTIGYLVNFMLLSELDRVLRGAYDADFGDVTWTRGAHRSREVYIVNSDRLMITESIFVEEAVLAQRVDTLPVESCMARGLGIYGFYEDYRGVEVAGASTCMPALGWAVLVEMDKSEVLGVTNRMLRNAVVATVVVVSLIGLLFLAFLRNVVGDIRRLAGASEALASGDYDVEVSVDRRDEIGLLADSFNRMAMEIRDRTEELSTERNRAESYLDVAGVMILALDTSGRITMINRKGCEVLGYTEGELTRVDWFEKVLPPESRESVRSIFIRMLSGEVEVVEYFEHKVVTRRGATRLVAWHNRALTDPEGRIVGTLSSGEDITERKGVEDALKTSEKKYRTLFEETKDAIFISDPKGRLTDINPAGVHLFGYTAREEILGTSMRDLCRDTGCWAYFMAELSREGFVKDHDMTMERRDGEVVYAQITANALKDRKGGVTSIRGIIRDITERRQLEQQLMQSQKMESVGQLSGGIAHDFNNILTAIIGYGNIVTMQMAEDDPRRGYVEQILRSAERASNLTQGLLAFSRKQVIELRPVRINEVITSVEKLLSRLITEDIELALDLTPVDPVVMADTGQVEQVLMNLATNARDAMPGGGKFSIVTEVAVLDEHYIKVVGEEAEPGEYVRLTASDTGEGMEDGTMDRVFDPFFTTKEVGKGTGLGMSIVYGIVHQHGGFIHVYSEPGRGTTFKVYLPVAGATEQGEAAEVPEDVTGGTETVLVAEDDPDVRRFMVLLLKEFGYKVLEASNGEEAVDTFAGDPDSIDLLLLDVIMPRKNGREVYEEVKKIRSGVKVLFSSGYAEEVIDRRGVDFEGMEFISKPVSPTGLLKKVREVLRR